MSNIGRTSYAGSCPHTDFHTSQYAVSQVVGFIKGKSAIHIERQYFGRRKDFTGQNFWARGFHVSTVGKDKEAIRKYIKEQE